MNNTNKNHNVIIVGINPTIDQVIALQKLTSGNHLRGEEISRFPAGKGINVFRALRVIGRHPGLIGYVGQFDQAWFNHYLNPKNNDSTTKNTDSSSENTPHNQQIYLVPFPAHTRNAVTLIDRSAGVETHIVTENPTLTPQQVTQFLSQFEKMIETHVAHSNTPTHIAFAGRLCPGFPMPDFEALIKMSVQAGAKVGVDASGQTLQTALKHPIWMIKPNADELAEIVDRKLNTTPDIILAMQDVSSQIENIVVTMGAQGAVGLNQHGIWQTQLETQNLNVISTVGCGDSFFAGLIEGWIQNQNNEQLPNAMRWGIATGTANTQYPTIAGFTLEDILCFINKVKVQKLDLGNSSA